MFNGNQRNYKVSQEHMKDTMRWVENERLAQSTAPSQPNRLFTFIQHIKEHFQRPSTEKVTHESGTAVKIKHVKDV